MNILEKLNERYGATNMTGFKLVMKGTDKSTVLRHFEIDLEILKTTKVKVKEAVRVIQGENVLDICSHDNGTPVTYYFTEDAQLNPEDIIEDVRALCEKFDITFDDLR